VGLLLREREKKRQKGREENWRGVEKDGIAGREDREEKGIPPSEILNTSLVLTENKQTAHRRNNGRMQRWL